jgi:AbrB family looped-hinge helix DNA binding protein
MVSVVSEKTVIGKRFTLVIPKAVKGRLRLREGQRVLVRVEKGKVVVDPLPWNPFEMLEKIVGRPYIEEREEAEAERWLKEHAGR